MNADWVPVQGFWLVQANGPIDEAANRKRMDELEVRLSQREQELREEAKHENSIHSWRL